LKQKKSEQSKDENVQHRQQINHNSTSQLTRGGYWSCVDVTNPRWSGTQCGDYDVPGDIGRAKAKNAKWPSC